MAKMSEPEVTGAWVQYHELFLLKADVTTTSPSAQISNNNDRCWYFKWAPKQVGGSQLTSQAWLHWIFPTVEGASVHSHINRDSLRMWICFPHSLCFFHCHHPLTKSMPHLSTYRLSSPNNLLDQDSFYSKGPNQRTYTCGVYAPITQKQLSRIKANNMAKLSTTTHRKSL